MGRELGQKVRAATGQNRGDANDNGKSRWREGLPVELSSLRILTSLF